jgi:hypothetical protein
MKKRSTTNKLPVTAAENLEKRFDDGDDVTDYFDLNQPEVSAPNVQRVNLDLPKWMIVALDQEAKRIGVTRQAIMKVWLDECLKSRKKAS